MRHPNTTADEMLASGTWARIGKRHYRHESGREVRHDGSGWAINDIPNLRYAALWVARMVVEPEGK